MAGERLLVPAPVVTEVCYLLQQVAGTRAEAAFLVSLTDADFAVVDLEAADSSRGDAGRLRDSRASVARVNCPSRRPSIALRPRGCPPKGT